MELPVSPGDVIAGRYRVDAQVGEGAMGAVFSATTVAHAPSVPARVAIKVLHPRHLREAEVLNRFLREARVASELASPHAVKVFEVGMLDDAHHQALPYFVMELLDGVDLKQHLEQNGQPSIGAIATWLLEACHALAEAHGRGIVHRDLKLANLFLADSQTGGRPQIKVIDFGVSKLLRPMEGAGDVTATTVVVGTPAFMAPEQMRSAAVDHRADIWALGVTLFWLLTGRRPFEGETIVKIYEGILRGPPSLLSLRPDAPFELEALIRRALSWDPENRLESVAAFADALRPFAQHPVAEAEVAMPAAPAVPPQDETALLDPAAIDLPPPPANRWKSARPMMTRAVVGLGVVGLAAGSYALGSAQGEAVLSAQSFGAQGLAAVAEDAVAGDAVAGDAVAGDAVVTDKATTAPAAPPPAAEAPPEDTAAANQPTATSSASARPWRPKPTRPKPVTTTKPKLTPDRAGKSDSVWGMP